MARPQISLAVALVLLVAGVAAANTLLAGPSPGLTASGGSLTAPPPTAPAAPSTVGPSTGSPASPVTIPGSTSTAPPASPVTTTPPPTGVTPTVEQIISLTRAVAPGSPVTAFTVPAGRQLVVTDVFVTNPGPSPSCGAAISPGGAGVAAAPAGPTTTAAGGPSTGAGESGTGVLCVPAQTSLSLGLTTGLEFAAGQSVVLANAATTEGAAATPLHYHLRGFLVTPGV